MVLTNNASEAIFFRQTTVGRGKFPLHSGDLLRFACGLLAHD
jgi:hypothetical protein